MSEPRFRVRLAREVLEVGPLARGAKSLARFRPERRSGTEKSPPARGGLARKNRLACELLFRARSPPGSAAPPKAERPKPRPHRRHRRGPEGCRISRPSFFGLNQGRRRRDAANAATCRRRAGLGAESLRCRRRTRSPPSRTIPPSSGALGLTPSLGNRFRARDARASPSHGERVAGRVCEARRTGDVWEAATARSRRSRRARMAGWASP